MTFLKRGMRLLIMIGAFTSFDVRANPYSYPGIRYVSPYSESLGGVTLPIANELGNALFNNPAALARNTMFKAEYLNLNIDLNSTVAGSPTAATAMFGLGGLTTSLNANTNQVYSGGFGNLTAVAWGGLGVGLLIQDRVRAYSDGTNVHYETISQTIPAVGYGFALARGVVRLGYSLQLVNLATGLSQSVSDSSASFMSGLSEGKALSHNASVNFVFPFTYLPTFSILARNIGNAVYSTGSLLPRAKSPSGAPSTEEMAVDAAFNCTVKITGTMKADFYLQYKDLTNSISVPVLEKVNFGTELVLSRNVGLRFGLTSTQISGGIGYRSESAEINLAYYNDPNPFKTPTYWDTRYALQYKVFFQDQNSRNREEDNRIK
jgi:hypothetical protein